MEKLAVLCKIITLDNLFSKIRQKRKFVDFVQNKKRRFAIIKTIKNFYSKCAKNETF